MKHSFSAAQAITEMKTEYVTEQAYEHKTEPQMEDEQKQETNKRLLIRNLNINSVSNQNRIRL
jgi:hypothetical protein